MTTRVLLPHWKASRLALGPFVLAAFALPLLSVQGLGSVPGVDGVDPSVLSYRLVGGAEFWMPVFPILAMVLGATLALTAWGWDHRQHHVYALSLPVPRWRYAAEKLWGGVILALIPAAALLLGAFVATAAMTLPEGLRAYPVALAVRFLLATLLIYSLIFAMASGTMRTFIILATTMIGAIVLGDLTLGFLANFYPDLADVRLSSLMADTLLQRGPLKILAGNWMLVDV